MTFPPNLRPPGWPPRRAMWMWFLNRHAWDTIYRKQLRVIWITAWLTMKVFGFTFHHFFRILAVIFALIFLGLVVFLPMTVPHPQPPR